jgi:transcriptional regulator with XRE-family HTH domain
MKNLNTVNIEKRLEELGLNSSALAKELGTTKQSVSNWLSNNKFPRPAKLLQLAKLLKLPFDQLVTKQPDPLEPVVAFRKKGSHKISAEYLEDAKDKGFLLGNLVPYLPFDELSLPPILKNPILDYDYIQKVANHIRNEIGKTISEKIYFEDLIEFFNTNHAVIIPVFGGNKQNHENALHVFLPASVTTWVYLNLDSKIHDFKFWMAHELGHVKAPNLRGDEAEDFADKFAGSLLFAEELAKGEYVFLRKLSGKNAQLNRIIEISKELLISPLTIYIEVNRYAKHYSKPEINLEQNRLIYRANTAFTNKYKTVAEVLFDELPPSPKKYIKISTEYFNTPVFDALKSYLLNSQKSPGFIQTLLSLSPVDANALYEEIC